MATDIRRHFHRQFLDYWGSVRRSPVRGRPCLKCSTPSVGRVPQDAFQALRPGYSPGAALPVTRPVNRRWPAELAEKVKIRII